MGAGLIKWGWGGAGGGGLITVITRCKKQKAVCNVCKMLSF